MKIHLPTIITNKTKLKEIYAMGILQRVVNMTKAATNEVLDKLENPVTMMNHYLRELDEKIAAAEQGMIYQQAQERMMIGKHDELSSHAALYEKNAAQAAAETREIEARAALEAMFRYQEKADETARLTQLAREAALDLELHIVALKEEKAKLQGKHAELVSRVRRANDRSAYSLQGNSSVEGFERIERKLLEMEAQHELGRIIPDRYSRFGADTIDTKQEQRNALVEEKLQQLMQKE